MCFSYSICMCVTCTMQPFRFVSVSVRFSLEKLESEYLRILGISSEHGTFLFSLFSPGSL